MNTNVSSKLLEKLKAYKAFANDCVAFKYIFSENDLNNESKSPENTFKPEYTHQIFGDDEEIIGYKGLKIKYYLTPASLQAYIGLVYNEKITPKRFEGIDADDIYDAFTQFGCSPGFTRNLDLFCSEKLKQDYEFRPFGIKVHEYSKQIQDCCVKNSLNGTCSSFKYEIFKVDSSCSEFHSQKFLDYLMRVQTMLVYFIETASFVDTDDDQWTFYFLYEKRQKNSKTNTPNSNIISGGGASNDFYVTVGYLSVYNYYAYPDKVRSRISQMLIMPPYQKNSHGARLMESVYRDVCRDSNIIDITAESPSNEFIKLRDYVTCLMCMKLGSFNNVDEMKKGFSKEMIDEAMTKYKMPKLQSRRCYEILRLKFTNENNVDEWTNYRLDIKKRLFMPFIRSIKFARNAGNPADSNNSDGDENKQDATSSKTLEPKCSVRFGSSEATTIGFGKGSVESSKSVTTIGFGNGKSSKSETTNGFEKSSVESSKCVTTIGFGNGGSSKGETTIGFGSSSNGKKVVSFATPLPPSSNKGNGHASKSYSSEDDEEENGDENQSTNAPTTAEYTNLLLNEHERKQFLEKEFQEAVLDYKHTLKRLENYSE